MADAGITPVELTFFAWNDALIRRDAKALLALYAPDARFESPLVVDLLGIDSGVAEGRGALKFLFDRMAERQVRVRKCYRTGHLIDGKHLTWDFPRDADGNCRPIPAETMELNDDGFIQRHAIHWDWVAARIPQAPAYPTAVGRLAA